MRECSQEGEASARGAHQPNMPLRTSSTTWSKRGSGLKLRRSARSLGTWRGWGCRGGGRGAGCFARLFACLVGRLVGWSVGKLVGSRRRDGVFLMSNKHIRKNPSHRLVVATRARRPPARPPLSPCHPPPLPPLRAWSASAPKMNMLSGPISSAISTLAPSMVPMMSALGGGGRSGWGGGVGWGGVRVARGLIKVERGPSIPLHPSFCSREGCLSTSHSPSTTSPSTLHFPPSGR